MNRTLSAAFFVSPPIVGTLSLLGQTLGVGVEQQLRSQYRIASVGNNGVMVRAGTVVIVQQDGITALPAPGEYPCNSRKEGGRISHQVGEKAYLTAIQVKSSELVFKEQTCCGGAVSAGVLKVAVAAGK
jgi:hypothetical protein